MYKKRIALLTDESFHVADLTIESSSYKYINEKEKTTGSLHVHRGREEENLIGTEIKVGNKQPKVGCSRMIRRTAMKCTRKFFLFYADRHRYDGYVLEYSRIKVTSNVTVRIIIVPSRISNMRM